MLSALPRLPSRSTAATATKAHRQPPIFLVGADKAFMAKNTKGAASWRPAEPADTPYQKARREWDTPHRRHRRPGGQLALVAFAELGLLLVASIGMIISARSRRPSRTSCSWTS